MNKKKMKAARKPGPKPEKLNLEGDWKDVVPKALAKGMPPKAVKPRKSQ